MTRIVFPPIVTHHACNRHGRARVAYAVPEAAQLLQVGEIVTVHADGLQDIIDFALQLVSVLARRAHEELYPGSVLAHLSVDVGVQGCDVRIHNV